MADNRSGPFIYTLSGTVQDLNIHLDGVNETYGSYYWGAVAGSCSGSITNCHVTGTVNLLYKSYVDADYSSVGGIAGYLSGTTATIENCTVGTQDSRFRMIGPNITANYIGGLAGSGNYTSNPIRYTEDTFENYVEIDVFSVSFCGGLMGGVFYDIISDDTTIVDVQDGASCLVDSVIDIDTVHLYPSPRVPGAVGGAIGFFYFNSGGNDSLTLQHLTVTCQIQVGDNDDSYPPTRVY